MHGKHNSHVRNKHKQTGQSQHALVQGAGNSAPQNPQVALAQVAGDPYTNDSLLNGGDQYSQPVTFQAIQQAEANGLINPWQGIQIAENNGLIDHATAMVLATNLYNQQQAENAAITGGSIATSIQTTNALNGVLGVSGGVFGGITIPSLNYPTNLIYP